MHFEVIAIIGDGAQCNRQFQNKYFTDGNNNNLHMAHPITIEPIYYISDPSHVVKKIVSSLSSKNRNIFKKVNICELTADIGFLNALKVIDR